MYGCLIVIIQIFYDEGANKVNKILLYYSLTHKVGHKKLQIFLFSQKVILFIHDIRLFNKKKKLKCD